MEYVSVEYWSYVQKAEFESDVKYLARDLPAQTGMVPPKTSEELQHAAMDKGKEYGVAVDSAAVKMDWIATPDEATTTIVVDYDAQVNLGVTSVPLHFQIGSTGHRVLQRFGR